MLVPTIIAIVAVALMLSGIYVVATEVGKMDDAENAEVAADLESSDPDARRHAEAVLYISDDGWGF